MSHENADFKAAVSNVGPTVSENRTAVHRGARANDGTATAAAARRGGCYSSPYSLVSIASRRYITPLDPHGLASPRIKRCACTCGSFALSLYARARWRRRRRRAAARAGAVREKHVSVCRLKSAACCLCCPCLCSYSRSIPLWPVFIIFHPKIPIENIHFKHKEITNQKRSSQLLMSTSKVDIPNYH